MNIQERLLSITSWIGKLFNHIPSDIRKYANKAHAITTAVKEDIGKLLLALTGNDANAIVAFIPGDWDNKLRDEAVLILKALAILVQKVDEAILTDEQKADAINDHLRGAASKLIALQDGNNLPQNRYDLYQQVAYSKSK